MIEVWDEETPPQPTHWRLEAAQAILFLTRLPLRIGDSTSLPRLSQAMRAFPLAGALVGLIAGLAGAFAFNVGLGGLASGAIATLAAILVTGGLHEDGLADLADGFWGGQTRERKLEIMRDSRIGSYGVMALALALLLKAALIGAILERAGGLSLIFALVGAGAFSRALMVPLLGWLKPAREDGLAAMAGTPSESTIHQAILGGGLAALIAFTLGVGLFAGIFALGLAIAATYGVARLAQAHIGGQTGDVCGAVSVCSELVAVAGLVMLLAAH